MDTPAHNALAGVVRPLQKLFSGAPLFPSTRSLLDLQFQECFVLATKPMPDTPAHTPWLSRYTHFADLAYGNKAMTKAGIFAGPPNESLLDQIMASLTKWIELRSSVQKFSEKVIKTDFELKNGSSVSFLENEVLDLQVEGSNLLKQVQGQISQMATIQNDLDETVASIVKVLADIRAGWVEFSECLCKPGLDNIFSHETDWFPILDAWSNFLEVCDITCALWQEIPGRYAELRKPIETALEPSLSTFHIPCFSIYCNSLAGASSEVREGDILSVNKSAAAMQDWVNVCPAWDVHEFESLKIAKSIQTGELIHKDGAFSTLGDDLAEALAEEEEHVQVSISRFEILCKGVMDQSLSHQWSDMFNFSEGYFGRLLEGGTWLERVLALEMASKEPNPPHKAARWLKPLMPDDSSCKFSAVSWIKIPPHLRDHWGIRFGSTTLSCPRNGVPSVDGKKKPWKCARHPSCLAWGVKFSQPINNNYIKVLPWIVGLTAENGVELTAENIGHNGFELHAQTYKNSILQKVDIRYIAHTENSENITNIKGFETVKFTFDRTLSTEEEWKQYDAPEIYTGPHGNTLRRLRYPAGPTWKPEFSRLFFRFAPGKFRRRPAVAVMLSRYLMAWAWEYRIKASYSVTRDGIVFQAQSWEDTVLLKSTFQVMAIANE